MERAERGAGTQPGIPSVNRIPVAVSMRGVLYRVRYTKIEYDYMYMYRFGSEARETPANGRAGAAVFGRGFRQHSRAPSRGKRNTEMVQGNGDA